MADQVSRKHYKRSYRAKLHAPPSANSVMYLAALISVRFPRTTATVEQLQQAFGMSQSNAYRWRAAMKAAKGEV